MGVPCLGFVRPGVRGRELGHSHHRQDVPQNSGLRYILQTVPVSLVADTNAKLIFLDVSSLRRVRESEWRRVAIAGKRGVHRDVLYIAL